MAIITLDTIAQIRDGQTDVLNMRLQEVGVCEYWQVIFSPRGIDSLSKQDMAGFLSYRQNKRWREISKKDVTSDMPKLQEALRILLDESRPIADRLDELEPGRGLHSVAHLGKAKLTPILLVTRPTSYGVWNDYSERALTGMGIMPALQGRLGVDYEAVNDVLVGLASRYGVNLWRLDIILEQIARLIR